MEGARLLFGNLAPSGPSEKGRGCLPDPAVSVQCRPFSNNVNHALAGPFPTTPQVRAKQVY